MTFFSGTDTSTLREEGNDRNNFVSLIVNNAGTYTAAITRKVKSTKTIKDCYSYEFFGEGAIEKCKDYGTESEEIEYYNLKVEKEEDNFQEMLARFAEIKDTKAKSVRKENVPFISANSDYYGFGNYTKKTDNSVKDIKPKQKTLFDDYNDYGYEGYEDYNYYNNSYGIKSDKISEDDPIPFGYIRFNEAKLKSLLAQLLTCSLIIPNENTIDTEKWAKSIPELYKKRFGDMKVFEDWADTYCEFLTWNAKDEDLLAMGYDQVDIQRIVAHDLIEVLEDLPQNDCIKVYIQKLEAYIIM